ncbi:MAG: DNA repair protein RecN [Sphingobacteriaceae bacterium]|nr:DNA repair protein RecN [Sphingobacteriaceae bacterium]
MLQRLAIRNYALIDTLDIDFSKELNILTGETGAGKSIILGALSLLLGQRAESKYFFNQEKKCVIEGAFKIDDYHLKQFFEEQDLDYEAETVLRREISLDGKTRAFINDTPVTVAILKQVGEQLIDIHSQHATLAINTESFQLLVLDTLCNHASLLAEYQQALGQHKQLTKKLKELELALSEAVSAQEYIQYQFEELEKADLQVNEQEDLEQELKSLTHAEEIKQNLSAALFLLSNGEQTSIAQLKEAVQLSQAIEKYATGIQPLIERLQSSLIELKDIAAELERLAQGTSINEARTNMISERLDILYTLQKKHRVNTVAELQVLRNQFSDQLQQLVSGEEEITRLQQEERVLKSNLVTLAQQLSSNRKQVIPALEQQVQEALTTVGMPHAQLRVSQETDINLLNLTGADRIQFLFSANKGQAPMPMNKVASGGELSRLMLCIKSLIAKKTALPTIIFDEIDTGISGEIALKVGAIMEQMAQSMQVITITHLPQIASKKGKHFRVFKNEAGEQTSTGIEALHNDERILEVAKMLGGEQASAAAMEHAKELLSN